MVDLFKKSAPTSCVSSAALPKPAAIRWFTTTRWSRWRWSFRITERILCPKPGKSFAIEYLSPALEFRLRKPTTVVDTVVFHATVEPTLKSSLSILRERGFSYHYLVDKDGTAIQCVAPTNVAFHAGQSTGPQGSGVNEYSIGISLVNLNNGIDPFTKAQIETAILIATRLKARFPNLKFITTHAAISPERKNDPNGFPIKDIAEATGLCVWL